MEVVVGCMGFVSDGGGGFFSRWWWWALWVLLVEVVLGFMGKGGGRGGFFSW